MEDEDDEDADEDDNMPYGLHSSTRSKKKTHSFDFSIDHPQHKTHRIHILSEDQERIPNFVGGVLPRSDKGDVEEYCRTMLTLFKPWTDPASLKQPEETWESAFNAYKFSDRHKQIMGFFNVRYECNDARDDFRSQRVNAAKDAGLNWIGGQFRHELDREAYANVSHR